MSASSELSVYFVVPDMIDDPGRVSGGNVYDQHLRDGLRGDRWDVRMRLVADDLEGHAAEVFAELPDGALTLVDGLVAVRESTVLREHSNRLHIVVLAHMIASATPGAIADGTGTGSGTPTVDREREALRSAKRVIATSEWTRAELISRDFADAGTVVVARPGTEPAPATVASRSGGRLLCVGVVAPHKGQDLLVRALAQLTDLAGWTCTLVGSRGADPQFVDELAHSIRLHQLPDRATFTGVLAAPAMQAEYSRADLVIVPSRTESFGMVVAEALARGIPVVAARVGGVPEATSGSAAAILIPPEDPWALEVVLRHWLANPARRRELQTAAMEARALTRPWCTAVTVVAETLVELARSSLAVRA